MKRNFIFVINNYTDSTSEELSKVKCKYMVFEKEKGEQGTPHIQGYVCFENAKSISAVSKIIPKAHIEEAKGNSLQNYIYCTKDNCEVTEFGTRPKTQQEKGEGEKERWKLARQAGKEGRFDDIPDDMYTRYQGSYKRMRAEDNLKRVGPLDHNTKHGLWIFGPTGTGKSRYVHETYNEDDLYMKGTNKWWCGYTGQKYVLIDELGPGSGEWIREYLKRWADMWPFEAEMKGGKMNRIRPEQIIVTSNYSLERVFGTWPEDLDALKRRFTIKEMN